MKYLRQLKYFIEIELLRLRGGIFISQRKYILDLLAATCMFHSKPTEIIANHSLQMIKGEKSADRGKYQRMLGKLIYRSHTRPDIACAVGVVSRLMHQYNI